MKKTFNRRVLLRGLGGAAVAAPFLPSVAEREAKAAGMAAAGDPRRLIVFFTHYGCLTDRWFPAKSNGPLTTADYTAMQTLKPMAPFADRLLMVRGIRAMNEWSFGATLGQKNDPHSQVCCSFFTCYPVVPNNTEASGASNPGKFDCKPTGRSLDHICAEQVNPGGATPLFLQIGGVNGSPTNTQAVISWDQPQNIFPGVGSPMQVFSNLTNLFGTGSTTTPSPDTYKVARGKSVIDVVRQDLTRLQGVNMSGADKKKLADWVDLLHYTSTTITSSAMCSMDVATNSKTGLGLTSDVLKAGSATGPSADIGKVANVMMDVAVLTALCDANRVIFMKMPPSYVYKNLGLTMESHSISHRIGNAGMGGTCVNGALDMVYTIDQYYAAQFAYLVNRLNSFSEGTGTVLDNSAAVWFQEMSDGNSHNLNNLPILQAGSCGGYFKTGQAINVEKGSATLSPGHSDDDCKNGMSTNLDSLGTPSDQASMPINKYFCNLMNAIGVKAGADGFAAKGGTAPVTKFGKYDDTKMFADGGTKDATITNPGEYMELRA
jgi:hypothetical protein